MTLALEIKIISVNLDIGFNDVHCLYTQLNVPFEF